MFHTCILANKPGFANNDVAAPRLAGALEKTTMPKDNPKKKKPASDEEVDKDKVETDEDADVDEEDLEDMAEDDEDGDADWTSDEKEY